ncbi:MAG: DUF1080 domain-containing protein [Planctomycetaceae bacterium]
MQFHRLLCAFSVLLFITAPALTLNADEFENVLNRPDSLSGWQETGSATFERNEDQLSLQQGEATLKFDFPLQTGSWSFTLDCPESFQGKVVARFESSKESHVLELVNSEIASSTGTTTPAFEISSSEIKWNRGDQEPLVHTRQSAAPLFLSLTLASASSEPVTLSGMKVVETNFKSLFNGTDLTGWEGGGQPADVCWKVEEGCIVCTGLKKGPWLRTAEEYGDFNLRIEYWLSAEGNSGLYVRVPEDGNHHRDNKDLPEAGFEIQLLDDGADVYKAMNLKDYQYTGSVYDIVGANEHVGKGPGTWNTLELNCNGQHITTIHNGKMIVNASEEHYPLLSLRKVKGYLGLQNHSSVVKFRNLRLGPALDY